MVGARPHLGMQTAGVGPLVIHRAAARLGIQKLAVTAGATGQAEDAVLEVEMFNQPGLGQALGDLFRVFVLGFKRVHPFEAHQVGQLNLDRHGAAIGGAGVAQAIFITGPSFATVNVDNGNGGSHGGDYPGCVGSNRLRLTPIVKGHGSRPGQIGRLRVRGKACFLQQGGLVTLKLTTTGQRPPKRLQALLPTAHARIRCAALRLWHQLAALLLHHGQATGDVDQVRQHNAVRPVHGVLFLKKIGLKVD